MEKNIRIDDLLPNEGQIDGLPRNPRYISEESYARLKKSIEDAPEMLDYRKLLVVPLKNKFVVICGNMRLRACIEIGYKEMPCYVLPAETPVEKLREYTIKDNAPFGTNDWDILANEWDADELNAWGVEVADWKVDDFEDGDSSEDEKPKAFLIEITCKDEEEQRSLFSELQDKGLNVKLK